MRAAAGQWRLRARGRAHASRRASHRPSCLGQPGGSGEWCSWPTMATNFRRMPEPCWRWPGLRMIRRARTGGRRPDCMIATLARRLPFFYGWVIVAVVFVTMAVGVNARTSFSLLFPPLLNEFGWDQGATAGAFSFGM